MAKLNGVRFESELLLTKKQYTYASLASKSVLHDHAIVLPNRTFLVLFGGILGYFGRAMIRILADV